MAKRHRGEKTGGYGAVFVNGRTMAWIHRRPLFFSQSHYRKTLKERARRSTDLNGVV